MHNMQKHVRIRKITLKNNEVFIYSETRPWWRRNTTTVETKHDHGGDGTLPRWRRNATAVETEHDRGGDGTRPRWRWNTTAVEMNVQING